MKMPILQKPNSSALFVGWKDVLDKPQDIYIHCADTKLVSRCSCLLWGTGIRKTQICLKFIEEMSSRLSHVFWVDASSVESIVMSLRGTSSISASQAPCLDDSIESILQWMSGIQEEWLIVFDNADEPPVHVVERFIPPENRGNILITSQVQTTAHLLLFLFFYCFYFMPPVQNAWPFAAPPTSIFSYAFAYHEWSIWQWKKPANMQKEMLCWFLIFGECHYVILAVLHLHVTLFF